MSSTGIKPPGAGETDENPAPFRRLKLSPEIRSHYYRLVVPQASLICVDCEEEFSQKLTQPAITRTNTAIRKETLQVFYRENEFGFVDGGGDLDVISAQAKWILDGWVTYWALVKPCTTESAFENVHDMFVIVLPNKSVTFGEGPLEDEQWMIFGVKVEDKTEAVVAPKSRVAEDTLNATKAG